jgi:hypothetical protein
MASPSGASLADVVERLRVETARITAVEPDEVRRLRTGQLAHRAGSGGQYFSTWDTAAGLLREYAGATLYPLVRLARQNVFEPAAFVTLLEELEAPGSRLLGFYGFPFLERASADLRSALPGEPNALDEALTALTVYANRLNSWSFHYFPWALGEQFRYTGEDVPELSTPDVQTPGAIEPRGPTIRLTWQPLNVSVRATLAAEQNPELCQELLAALPLTVLQDHAVVAGESMFAWTPLVSTATVAVRERICDAPVGRMRYQFATGQKVVVAYGQTRETAAAPVLGQVHADDVPLLPEVGRRVAESTFRSKDLIWLTVSQ